MSDACRKCPCPDICIRLSGWCDRADSDALTPLESRSICERSRIGRGMEPARRPAYPPLPRQATNLAASLWDWATSGFRMAPAAEVDRRLAICRACPQYDAAAARCRLCGCFAQAKVRLKTERCPLPEPKW